jgi:hypothetical protein
MCTSIAEGGGRCAFHTRPDYRNAPFGTPEWDSAAAAYASTPTGRMELASSLAAAEAAEDIPSVVAIEHALREGDRMRDKAALFRDELATRTTEPPVAARPAEPFNGPDDSDNSESDDRDDYDDYDNRDDDSDESGPSFRLGGYRYAEDESAWDARRPRSARMTGHTWPTTSPLFANCSAAMSHDQFVEQVCTNATITRAEFDVAAAEYLRSHQVALMSNDGLPQGTLGRLTGSAPSWAETEALRFEIANAVAPEFTPAQMAEIVAIAQRNQADRLAATPTATPTESVTPAAPNLAASLNPEATPESLTALATDPDNNTRINVAAHPNTPAETLARLVTSDSKIEVRAAAARNENLPVPALVGLVNNRSIKVRAGAARNPAMPVDHLNNLAVDDADMVRGSVARNPSTDPDVYRVLAGDNSETVRKSAARRANIPAEIATTLAADDSQQVRSTLARNRTTTDPALLRTLAKDDAQSVRAAAAKNRAMTPALLRGRLSRDPAPGVRAAVARNENTSIAVLTRLSSDNDPWVRRNIAWNAATPTALIYVLANDEDPDVRHAVQTRH